MQVDFIEIFKAISELSTPMNVTGRALSDEKLLIVHILFFSDCTCYQSILLDFSDCTCLIFAKILH